MKFNEEKILKLLGSTDRDDVALAFEILRKNMSNNEIMRFLHKNKCRRQFLINPDKDLEGIFHFEDIVIAYYFSMNASSFLKKK